MSANIIRYFPGGRTLVIGIKPKTATTVFKYTPGNPKNSMCPVMNGQAKNAKDLILLPICCPLEVCTIYDGGSSLSEFPDLLVDNGSGILLDAGKSYTKFCI
jgi:hypothetical protein